MIRLNSSQRPSNELMNLGLECQLSENFVGRARLEIAWGHVVVVEEVLK